MDGKNKFEKEINHIYNEICKKAFSLDKYGLPYYGIKHPHKENPINLFQRQLKIEELSFELAHDKYTKNLKELIKIDRASSNRVIIHWMKTLDAAVAE